MLLSVYSLLAVDGSPEVISAPLHESRIGISDKHFHVLGLRSLSVADRNAPFTVDISSQSRPVDFLNRVPVNVDLSSHGLLLRSNSLRSEFLVDLKKLLHLFFADSGVSLSGAT